MKQTLFIFFAASMISCSHSLISQEENRAPLSMMEVSSIDEEEMISDAFQISINRESNTDLASRSSSEESSTPPYRETTESVLASSGGEPKTNSEAITIDKYLRDKIINNIYTECLAEVAKLTLTGSSVTAKNRSQEATEWEAAKAAAQFYKDQAEDDLRKLHREAEEAFFQEGDLTIQIIKKANTFLIELTESKILTAAANIYAIDVRNDIINRPDAQQKLSDANKRQSRINKKIKKLRDEIRINEEEAWQNFKKVTTEYNENPSLKNAQNLLPATKDAMLAAQNAVTLAKIFSEKESFITPLIEKNRANIVLWRDLYHEALSHYASEENAWKVWSEIEALYKPTDISWHPSGEAKIAICKKAAQTAYDTATSSTRLVKLLEEKKVACEYPQDLWKNKAIEMQQRIFNSIKNSILDKEKTVQNLIFRRGIFANLIKRILGYEIYYQSVVYLAKQTELALETFADLEHMVQKFDIITNYISEDKNWAEERYDHWSSELKNLTNIPDSFNNKTEPTRDITLWGIDKKNYDKLKKREDEICKEIQKAREDKERCERDFKIYNAPIGPMGILLQSINESVTENNSPYQISPEIQLMIEEKRKKMEAIQYSAQQILTLEKEYDDVTKKLTIINNRYQEHESKISQANIEISSISDKKQAREKDIKSKNTAFNQRKNDLFHTKEACKTIEERLEKDLQNAISNRSWYNWWNNSDQQVNTIKVEIKNNKQEKQDAADNHVKVVQQQKHDETINNSAIAVFSSQLTNAEQKLTEAKNKLIEYDKANKQQKGALQTREKSLNGERQGLLDEIVRLENEYNDLQKNGLKKISDTIANNLSNINDLTFEQLNNKAEQAELKTKLEEDGPISNFNPFSRDCWKRSPEDQQRYDQWKEQQEADYKEGCENGRQHLDAIRKTIANFFQ